MDIDRHKNCKRYAQEYSCSFQEISGDAGSIFYVDKSDYYGILFLIEGRLIHLESKEDDKELKEDTIIFLDKLEYDSFSFLTHCTLYYLEFKQPAKLCDNYSISMLKPYAPHVHATYTLPIVKPLQLALDSCVYYYKDGLKCGIVMDAKLKEIFFVLSSYYSKEELGKFLSPLLREEINFKDFVLNNFLQCNSVQELADKKGVSVRLFNKMFKEAFNMPPYQWMLAQKGEVIKDRLARKEIPFSDIIEEFRFSSPSHFTVYCRKQFGMTPSKMRKKLLAEQRQQQ